MCDDKGIKELINQISEMIDDPTRGLPEDIFLFVTEITPMVNVDLLIRDNKGRILLAWRKDQFYEEGWHIPGGILRVKENLEDRILKVGEIEIGCPNIIFNPKPLEIVPIICPEMKQRGHFITFVYECSLPDKFEIKNSVGENEAGYLKWHDSFPENMLEVHSFYRKYWCKV